jgi:hypothetical protein
MPPCAADPRDGLAEKNALNALNALKGSFSRAGFRATGQTKSYLAHG